MRKRLWIPVLAALLLNGCNNASAGQDKLDGEAVSGSVALEAAQVAFVKKDFKEMGLAIKTVLSSGAEPEVQSSAIKLLDQVYTENCEYNFPVDWHLPVQIIRMSVDQMRNLEPDGVWYRTLVSGHLKEIDGIQQLRLVQFPNKVIADKQAGIGEWEVEVDPNDPSDIYYALTQKDSKEAVQPGLFLLEIVTKDGRTTKGWFILNDQFSSASPVVHSPTVGEHFASGTPDFRWNDFKSPEYKACERRKMNIYVTKIPSSTWDLRWSVSGSDPGMTSATVGSDGIGNSSLEPGRYWFSLFYRETRQFGDLELRRRSATSRNFYID